MADNRFIIKLMIIFLNIILLIIVLVVIFWQISTFISLGSGIQYVYSKDKVIRSALKLADLKKSENFLELGSGMGNGLLIAAKNFGAQATGVEISPFHYLISKIRTMNNPNIKVIRGDFRKVDFSGFEVIYCYLCTKLMKELLPQFKKQLHPGTRVVSYCFEIPDLIPDKIKTIGSKKIYLYQF